MRGYTIQNSINLLEKGGGAGGASSAAGVSFDNTGTGLAATNVQTALGELDARSKYSTTKQKIGKWIDGRDVYRLVIDFEEAILCSSQTWAITTIAAADLNIDTLINAYGSNGAVYYPMAVACTLEDTYLSLLNVRTVQVSVKTVVLEYVENVASSAKTRKKKQEELKHEIS